MRGRTNISTGAMNINGAIETYTVKDSNTIYAGDFVQFVPDSLKKSIYELNTGDSIQRLRTYSLDETTLFVTYSLESENLGYIHYIIYDVGTSKILNRGSLAKNGISARLSGNVFVFSITLTSNIDKNYILESYKITESYELEYLDKIDLSKECVIPETYYDYSFQQNKTRYYYIVDISSIVYIADDLIIINYIPTTGTVKFSNQLVQACITINSDTKVFESVDRAFQNNGYANSLLPINEDTFLQVEDMGGHVATFIYQILTSGEKTTKYYATYDASDIYNSAAIDEDYAYVLTRSENETCFLAIISLKNYERVLYRELSSFFSDVKEFNCLSLYAEKREDECHYIYAIGNFQKSDGLWYTSIRIIKYDDVSLTIGNEQLLKNTYIPTDDSTDIIRTISDGEWTNCFVANNNDTNLLSVIPLNSQDLKINYTLPTTKVRKAFSGYIDGVAKTAGVAGDSIDIYVPASTSE